MDINFIDKQYSKCKNLRIENSVIGALISSYDSYSKYLNKLNIKSFVDLKNKAVIKLLQEEHLKDIDKEIISYKLSKVQGFNEDTISEDVAKYFKSATKNDVVLGEQIELLKELEAKRNLLLHIQNLFIGIVNNEKLNDLIDNSRKKLSQSFTIDKEESVDQLKNFHYSIVNETPKLFTGFDELDGITNGFEKGTVTIVAGRPSMGKSAFGLNLLLNFCKKGFAVPFFSIEMNSNSLIARLCAIDTNIPIKSVKDKGQYMSNVDKFKPLFNSIKENKILLDDGTNDLNKIISSIQVMKMKYDIDAVIIDYLQLIKYSNNTRSREQEVAYISQSIKNDIAKAIDIPVILLAQLSRQAESRKESRPQMSDLRESGSIENDADNIILLHRPEYYDHNTMNNPIQRTELIVAKGRNCGTGIANASFYLDTNKFSNINYND